MSETSELEARILLLEDQVKELTKLVEQLVLDKGYI